MKERFLELFDQVFDQEGNVKPCGRAICVRLIEACQALAPNLDEAYYGYTDPNNPKRGYMNVHRIKALHDMFA